MLGVFQCFKMTKRHYLLVIAFFGWNILCIAQVYSPLCGLVASTNIETLYSEWSCNDNGQTVTNPCNPMWYGVNCSFTESAFGSVYSISLESIGLNGTISPVLSELKSLQYIYLNNNTLTHRIPSNIGTLSNLLVLELSRNRLNHVIPSSIGSLSSLSVLSVERCGLFGSLPLTIKYLTNLVSMNVEFNHLSGTVGTELWNLNKLTYLSIGNNNFRGDISTGIGGLTLLEALYFGYNNITGTLPSSLCNLTRLVYLSGCANHLTGSIPSDIGDLSLLIRLSLFDNHINGTVPSSVGLLTLLRHFALNDNSITGSIPSTVGNMIMLRGFSLHYNSLTSSIPDIIGSLRYLTLFNVGTNSLDGSFPPVLCNLTQLHLLYTAHNHLSGTIPNSIGNLTRLNYLQISSNSMTGTIPSTIGLLSELRTLEVLHNDFVGVIPTTIGYLTKILTLNLGSNKLTGGIPSEVKSLIHTTYLSISYTFVGGSLPVGVGNLKRLFRLDVVSSMLTGTLPSILGTLTDLKLLSLAKNQLSGSIPLELSNLSILRYLYLNDNQFTGSIPSAMGQFKVLGYLFLENNLLNGTIPDTMSEIRTLRYITMNNNMLSGSIGTSFSGFESLTKLDLSNNQLTGSIPLNIAHTLGYINFGMNRLNGTIPNDLTVLKTMEYFNVSGNTISGNIPSELCESTSVRLDVSNTNIHCYSGCLTSSEVLIIGASNVCHDGSVMELFLIVIISAIIAILFASVCYRVTHRKTTEQLHCWYFVAKLGNECGHKTCDQPETTVELPTTAGAEGSTCLPVSAEPLIDSFTNDYTIIGASLAKLGIAVAIALFLTEWWIYNSSSTTIVESCSNDVVGDCEAFCGDVTIVQVNITDDDYVVHPDSVGPAFSVTTSAHITETDYCIAELPGSCAKKFWMVFKFVPLMLHVFQFVLQCLFFYLIKEFNPQQRQYDVIIQYLYPNIASHTIGFSAVSTNDSNDRNMQGSPRKPALPDDPTLLRLAMLHTLMETPMYNVFAFIEIFTVLYVWGELQFPAVYCGQVRPLSLYYYPMAMSWLDLIKLNLYVCARHAQNHQYVNGLLALLNIELFMTNTWVAFVLAISYGFYMCVYLCYLPWLICDSVYLKSGEVSKSANHISDAASSRNPIHVADSSYPHSTGGEVDMVELELPGYSD